MTEMDERLLRDVEILNDLMKQGGWSELRVTGPNVSVLFSSDDRAALITGAQAAPSAPVAAPAPAASATPAAPEATAAPAAASQGPVDPAWTAVVAPNLGTFYRAPKPGAPPFVEVGQEVAVGTELCLIEVMKLFTSVRSEIAGVVRHIAVADAELVEGGQALIYIESN
ncbi:MAG: acetyl-CoA carboxylase, biotin carboxyl carrier protein [Novosphingobium sp.]|nr:acetyl-CoA carboxylase, biotin carboxyl carrier protein [Novosphingobium sp.]